MGSERLIGLTILTAFGLVFLVDGCRNHEVELEKIRHGQPTVHIKNVGWGPEPETFYDGPQGRGYLKIDGKFVGDYDFSKK